MSTSGLGALLVEEGLLTETDRRMIRRTCGSHGAAFARSIVAMGLLDEDELAAFLAERTHWRVAPKALLDHCQRSAVAVVDRPLLERLEVLPIKLDGNTLQVAVIDPLDQDTLRQLSFFTGYKIQPVIATMSAIRDALTRLLKGYRPASSHLEEFLSNHAPTAHRRLRLTERAGARAQPRAAKPKPTPKPAKMGRIPPPAPAPAPSPVSSSGSGSGSGSSDDITFESENEADLAYPDAVTDAGASAKAAESDLDFGEPAAPASSAAAEDEVLDLDPQTADPGDTAPGADQAEPSQTGDSVLANNDTALEGDMSSLDASALGGGSDDLGLDSLGASNPPSVGTTPGTPANEAALNDILGSLPETTDQQAAPMEAPAATAGDGAPESAFDDPGIEDFSPGTTEDSDAPTDLGLSEEASEQAAAQEEASDPGLEDLAGEESASQAANVNPAVETEMDASGTAEALGDGTGGLEDLDDFAPAAAAPATPTTAGTDDEFLSGELPVVEDFGSDSASLAAGDAPITDESLSDGAGKPSHDPEAELSADLSAELTADDGSYMTQEEDPFSGTAAELGPVDGPTFEPTSSQMDAGPKVDFDADDDIPFAADEKEDHAALRSNTPKVDRAAEINRSLFSIALSTNVADGVKRAAGGLAAAGIPRGVVYTIVGQGVRPVASWMTDDDGVEVTTDGLGALTADGLAPALARVGASWSELGGSTRWETMTPFMDWAEDGKQLLAVRVPAQQNQSLAVVATFEKATAADQDVRAMALLLVQRLAQRSPNAA